MGDELNKDGAAADQAGQEGNKAPENGGKEPETGGKDQEKKYTDADVDRIVSKRLARERAKQNAEDGGAAADLDRREHEIEKRERKISAREELEGLPKALIDLVDCESEDSYKSSIKAIKAAYEEIRADQVKQAAAGKTPKAYGSGGKPDGTAAAFGLKR